MTNQSTRQDISTRVTSQIARQLEQGVRLWMKLWSVEHTAGRITRPLRHKAIPYRSVNVLLLWSEAVFLEDAMREENGSRPTHTQTPKEAFPPAAINGLGESAMARYPPASLNPVGDQVRM